MVRIPQLLVSFSLVLTAVGCNFGTTDADAKESSSKSKSKSKKGDKADKKSDEKKEEVPALVERDITKEATEFIPGFKGKKMTVLAPKDAEVTRTVGGLNVKTEGFGVTIMVGTVKVKDRKAKIEAGDSPEKNAKIVDEGEGYILYEGDSFGQHGFFVMHDLKPIDGIIAGCSTPIAQPYPRPIADAVLKACQSVKVE
jgi:hypothetical protein